MSGLVAVDRILSEMSVQPPRNTRFIGLAIDGGLVRKGIVISSTRRLGAICLLCISFVLLTPTEQIFLSMADDIGPSLQPPSETSDIYHMHDPLIERTYPIIRGFIAGRIPPWSFADRLREVGVPECIFATREFQLLLQREYEVDCLPFNTVRLVLKRLIKACRDKRFRARHGDRFDDTRDEATSTDDRMFSRTVSKLEESAVQTDGMDLTRVHGTPLEHRVGLSPEKRLQYLPLNERQCYLRDEQQRETSKGGDSETWTRPRSQRH